ncbi:MAG: hypothetical protein COB15_03490 [Flavobacteriales bacterium]|nr:MAG: hypothetical protein COB15_03490 [Flavobacteriales bacterium]
MYSQARVVINNNGYIVIDNGAFLVLDNANSNALTTTGTGGNIVSEDEDDVIQWEIGTTTGIYTIPWTTKPVIQGGNGTKIPLIINKTTAGTGATAEFILSTYETATDMNAPYPSAVTNMNYSGVDKSLFVIDRFWHIDALSYTPKPDITLTIAYDPTANEMVGTNTITEANLQAQRFNTGLGHWEAYNLFGTGVPGSDFVNSIVVTSSDFYEDWILVDNTNPLPVELVSFNASCKSNAVNIDWSTQTEINNDYFVVEKSYDAVNFFELTIVQGAGNSSVINYYSAIDSDPASGVSYYRLKQVDFNGDVEYHQLVSTSCGSEGFVVDQLILKNNALGFNITTALDEDLTIYFYDYRGRVIANKVEHIQSGNNFISLSNLELSTGIYMLSIVGKHSNYATKLMNRKQ